MDPAVSLAAKFYIAGQIFGIILLIILVVGGIWYLLKYPEEFMK